MAGKQRTVYLIYSRRDNNMIYLLIFCAIVLHLDIDTIQILLLKKRPGHKLEALIFCGLMFFALLIWHGSFIYSAKGSVLYAAINFIVFSPALNLSTGKPFSYEGEPAKEESWIDAQLRKFPNYFQYIFQTLFLAFAVYVYYFLNI